MVRSSVPRTGHAYNVDDRSTAQCVVEDIARSVHKSAGGQSAFAATPADGIIEVPVAGTGNATAVANLVTVMPVVGTAGDVRDINMEGPSGGMEPRAVAAAAPAVADNIPGTSGGASTGANTLSIESV